MGSTALFWGSRCLRGLLRSRHTFGALARLERRYARTCFNPLVPDLGMTNTGLADPKVKARIGDPAQGSLAEFDVLMVKETETWAKPIKRAGIKRSDPVNPARDSRNFSAMSARGHSRRLS